MSMSSKLKDQQEKQSELLLEKMNGLVNELGKLIVQSIKRPPASKKNPPTMSRRP